MHNKIQAIAYARQCTIDYPELRCYVHTDANLGYNFRFNSPIESVPWSHGTTVGYAEHDVWYPVYAQIGASDKPSHQATVLP